MEGLAKNTIEENLTGGRMQNEGDPFAPFITKYHGSHDLNNGFMFHFGKCFFKIQFEKDDLFSSLMRSTDVLKCPSKTVLDSSSFNETILVMVNELENDRWQSVGLQLGDEL